jgi:hypothetical protein
MPERRPLAAGQPEAHFAAVDNRIQAAGSPAAPRIEAVADTRIEVAEGSRIEDMTAVGSKAVNTRPVGIAAAAGSRNLAALSDTTVADILAGCTLAAGKQVAEGKHLAADSWEAVARTPAAAGMHPAAVHS